MYDAVVLAGGAGRRLGGVDKPALAVGGITLLDRVLLACAGAATTVVVGPPRSTCRSVVWAREDPAGGGPLAALAAGLERVSSPMVLVVAADLPFLTESAVAALTQHLPAEFDGAVMHDGEQAQWLTSAWRTSSLLMALDGRSVTGGRLGALLEPLVARRVATAAEPAPWLDVDTEQELHRARELS